MLRRSIRLASPAIIFWSAVMAVLIAVGFAVGGVWSYEQVDLYDVKRERPMPARLQHRIPGFHRYKEFLPSQGYWNEDERRAYGQIAWIQGAIEANPHHHFEFVHTSYGWPRHVLQWTDRYELDIPPCINMGMTRVYYRGRASLIGDHDAQESYLPSRVLFGPLALNLIFYFSVSYLLLSMARTAFLFDRQLRGKCICGYDIRGLPSNRCPECGRELTQVPVASEGLT